MERGLVPSSLIRFLEGVRTQIKRVLKEQRSKTNHQRRGRWCKAITVPPL
jgi:hypothetical protein